MAQHRREEPYARLSCRVNARIKSRAEEAANVLGLSITDFTEAALNDKAEAVLESQSKIALSERDFERFLRAIESPSVPTPTLRKALANNDLFPK